MTPPIGGAGQMSHCTPTLPSTSKGECSPAPTASCADRLHTPCPSKGEGRGGGTVLDPSQDAKLP